METAKGWRLKPKMELNGFVVVDGVEGKQYDEIKSLRFSQDSKRLAYPAKIDDKWVVVVDGVEGKQYDDLGLFIYLNTDNNTLVYPARINDKWFVVVDES